MADKFVPVHYVSAPYNSMKFFVELDGKSKQMSCENGAFVAETQEVYDAVEAERARSVSVGAQLRKVDRSEALAIAEAAKAQMRDRNSAQSGPFQSVHAVSAAQRTEAIMREGQANNAVSSAAAVANALAGSK